MVAFSDLTQVMQNARTDAKTLDEYVHGAADTQVTSRLGKRYWTLATLDNKLSLVKIKAEKTLADIDTLAKSATDSITAKVANANTAIDAQVASIDTRADNEIANLQSAINAAAAAGAGANGWTALLVKDKSGLTQQQINDLTYAHFVEKWGAKGDGVTQDRQAIQAAIDELHTKWLSTNKEATLLFTADKTYLCHSITIKAGVHLACKNGKAKLLKTPADATDTAETLKWRRVITMDNGIGIKAPNIRHRIENLIIDGNYNNLNWAFNTYDQEQGMNIILSARNGDNADTRAKFELTNVESINSTSDGVCVNTNVDVLINNYKAINCFRGGLVAVGGNSIINGIRKCGYYSRSR